MHYFTQHHRYNPHADHTLLIGPYDDGVMRKGPSAMLQGYAVVSQDSGHDNRINDDPTHGGTAAFGFDPVARSNYGHVSLKLVADAAKAFRPKILYPYHYGETDPSKLTALLKGDPQIEVRIRRMK